MLAAWGFLEWVFAALLAGLTAAVALVFLYMVAQLFVNPARRRHS
jgi:membrane protein YdbS with pleckstrin-like domain